MLDRFKRAAGVAILRPGVGAVGRYDFLGSRFDAVGSTNILYLRFEQIEVGKAIGRARNVHNRPLKLWTAV